MTEQGDKLTCATCGTEGVGIGFAHDCAIVLRVDPNDDELLTCWLCHSLAHIPCELSSTFYTRDGRATVGLHRCCYDRARVKIAKPLRPSSQQTTETRGVKAETKWGVWCLDEDCFYDPTPRDWDEAVTECSAVCNTNAHHLFEVRELPSITAPTP